MRNKLNSEFVYILHLNDHFSNFNKVYTLKNKNTLEIAYYIRFFGRHLGVSEILQCNNDQEFKGALVLFLKKHDNKLINDCSCTLSPHGLVEKVNVVVKDKIRKWQAANGIRAWAHGLIEICKAINNQGHKSFPTGVTPSQLMFLCKLKI